MSDESSPAPWSLESDTDNVEHDAFDSEGKLIAMIMDTGDPLETMANAGLMIGAPKMWQTLKDIVKHLREGEDREALNLAKATLQEVGELQSLHGHPGNGAEAANENGGSRGDQPPVSGRKAGGASGSD